MIFASLLILLCISLVLRPVCILCGKKSKKNLGTDQETELMKIINKMKEDLEKLTENDLKRATDLSVSNKKIVDLENKDKVTSASLLASENKDKVTTAEILELKNNILELNKTIKANEVSANEQLTKLRQDFAYFTGIRSFGENIVRYYNRLFPLVLLTESKKSTAGRNLPRFFHRFTCSTEIWDKTLWSSKGLLSTLFHVRLDYIRRRFAAEHMRLRGNITFEVAFNEILLLGDIKILRNKSTHDVDTSEIGALLDLEEFSVKLGEVKSTELTITDCKTLNTHICNSI